MPRVVVDVMLKPEILDPQGKAISQTLPRLGFAGVSGVRAGKHFVLDVAAGVTDQTLREIAGRLLANPVIEDFTITAEPTECATQPEGSTQPADGALTTPVRSQQ